MSRSRLRVAAACVALGVVTELFGCGADERPSIVLIVIDTLRADAVSAYGEVADTTPTLDALAAEGLRYTNAFSNAPWSLPAHASLFTGLLPSSHAVGSSRAVAPDELTTLAEMFRDAGYATIGVSENVFVSRSFNLDQGFEWFKYKGGNDPGEPVDVLLAERWKKLTDDGRPFFLFVNIVDPHAPYEIRADNRFVRPGSGPMPFAGSSVNPDPFICRADQPEALGALHALYLGDVAQADARVRGLLDVVREPDTIVVITSDHGELFGEHGLISHQFSLADALLRIPLIVAGLPDARPAVIDAPVQIADLTPTLLRWAGLPVPAGLQGRPLPTSAQTSEPTRALVAEYTDPANLERSDPSKHSRTLLEKSDMLRGPCASAWPVRGDIRALIRHPHKWVHFENFAPALYDLGTDPKELHDLAALQPELAAELAAALPPLAAPAPAPTPSASTNADDTLSDETLRQLQALGYAAPN